MHTYFMRYRFTHPTQEDFMRTVNEVAGQDLGWYWNQAVYGTQMLDYEVLRADSTPVRWYEEKLKEKKGETEYETQVLLHRKGDFIFPIEAVVKFDDGSYMRERWDGRERWARYLYRKKAQVESVALDPAYQVTLDNDFLNNSRVTETQHAAALKIDVYWTFVTQFLAGILSWLA